MKSFYRCLAGLGLFGVLALGACGDDVPLGTVDRGTGGAGGSQGGSGGTSAVDAPVVSSGGQAGSATGGTTTKITGTGGIVGGGGTPASGGTVGTGGTTATGTTGLAGSTGTRCGTIAGLTCAAGQFCDLASNCDTIADAGGVCVATGGGCLTVEQPVCGCDGRTYSNDCVRIEAGKLKAHDGACTAGTGGRIGPGGMTGTGGRIGTGGVVGSGGATGTGGSTGGSTGSCGSTSAIRCAAGYLCDLASNCGQIANAPGTCQLSSGLVCGGGGTAVCGCDGKTYLSDCERILAGVLKSSDGACPGRDGGVPSYPGAYLAWRMNGGVAGTGPAIVLSGAGWADTWTNVVSFPPETPPSSATGTYTLTSAQTDDLFGRLASVNLASLPHPASAWYECSVSLYFRTCATCAPVTLSYGIAPQAAPEMDPVWLWFDRLLGASTSTNPRNYCYF